MAAVPTGALVCISIDDVPDLYESTPCVVTVAVPASKPVLGLVVKLIVDASSVRSPPVSKVKVKSPDAVLATVMPAALKAVSSADAIAPAEALAATDDVV